MSDSLFALAQESYAALGVDVEAALKLALETPISLHCWQGDDVGGFETTGALGGGLAVTGNYPGKARTIDELRGDLESTLRLLPGAQRLNLHAIYGDFEGNPPSRDAIELKHFQSWIDWAKRHDLGLDFNPTCFGHPMAEDGFTLSHRDSNVRDFWIAHCQASRRIGAEMGRQLGSPSVVNIWIPDGYKDFPVDRNSPRERLRDSLDAVLAEALNTDHVIDAVESKLFGIGSEAYVVGSHEFYFGYAAKNQTWLCLDAGHFHPTESVADKVSSTMLYVPGVLLHVSRGMRWDSDHVVLFDDQTKALVREIVSGCFLKRTAIGLDFFDASINRQAAWAIGARAARKALLQALLEPAAKLREFEAVGDYTGRLLLQEEISTLPFGAVWNELCARSDVPADRFLQEEIRSYEDSVLAKRQ
jgi:L-rhamnose isomerase